MTACTPVPDDPPRPLNVLHLTAASDAGGISRYLHDLCAAMHAAGHRVRIAGARGAWHHLFEHAPWPWIELRLNAGPLALWRSARELERILQREPADVIHCHYRRASLVGRRLQQRLGTPLLFTLHLTDIRVTGLARRLSDFGDLTHAPSTEARDWLIQHARVPADRIVVIPHGINPPRFPLADPDTQAHARETLGLPAHAPIAAYVGRFDVPKNEHWLLDLADRSRHTLPDLHVVLMGEGPHEPQLRRQIDRQNLADRVTLLPPGDPLPVYQACDALLLPSSREGFSLVCAEAMSVGRPVLRTRTAGTADMIVEGRTGRSVAIDREAFLAAALALLADRPALATMGAAAGELVRRQLRFDQQVHRTTQMYHALAHSPRAMDALGQLADQSN